MSANKANEQRNAYMREYMKEYRKKNKEKIKEWQDNYWLNLHKKQNGTEENA